MEDERRKCFDEEETTALFAKRNWREKFVFTSKASSADESRVANFNGIRN